MKSILRSTAVRCLLSALFTFSLAGAAGLYSQYILDDEEKEQKEDTRPIEEKKEKIPGNIAFNIRATRVPEITDLKCAIKVTWDINPEYAGEFIVAKSGLVIDTPAKAQSARIIQTVKATSSNVIIDTDCTPGSHYYVVLPKRSVIDNVIELFPDVNYTSLPVVVPSGDEMYSVTKLRAEVIEGYKVRLTWEKNQKSGIFYSVYRSRNVIDNETKLRAAERVKLVADVSDYTDDGIVESGTYYYAVTAKVLFGRENTLMVPEENHTTRGITIQVGDRIRISSIRALPGKTGVQVSWNYSGSAGGTSYSIFRSEKILNKATEVTSGDIVSTVDLKTKQHLDGAPFRGAFYYGIIPNDASDRERYELVPGVTITGAPVKIGDDRVAPPVGGDIDRILKRTFFRDRFREAIKELGEFISRSDNEEDVARARLFIGRSHIGLAQYRQAVETLILKDVRKYFPREASFWEEFALTRIRVH